MDLFEFTEMLRRQKVLLIAGTVLLIGLIASVSLEYDNGLRFRMQPRYESSIQMAVVPAEFDSLGNTLPNVGAMAGTTSLYATLLASPEAAVEISEESGVQLLDTLAVATTGRDGFIDVKVTTATAAGATEAALYSFTWLEKRISTPPSIVRPDASEPEPPPPPLLDEDGRFMGTIRLEASPAFADTAIGLWVGLTTSDSTATVSLADAAVRISEFTARLEPEGEMVVSLEDVFGNELDAIAIAVPPLPGAGTARYDLIVRLDRGILLYPSTTATGADEEPPAVATDPKLLARHIDVSWQQTAPAFTVQDDSGTADAVGLLLLTGEPVATKTGARRGPILVIGALAGGFYALIVLIVGVDTWRRAKRRSEEDSRAIAELRDTAVQIPARDEVGERR